MKLDPTKDAETNVLALINAANSTALTKGTEITLGTPVATTGPNNQNTKVTATGSATANITGSKDFYYNRIPMRDSALNQATSMHIDISMVSADIIDSLSAAWGLVGSEIQDITPPPANQGALNFSAKTDSLLYTGSDSISLIWDSVVASQPYGAFFSGDDDDNFLQLPACPFDFMFFGINLKRQKSFGVCANSFFTMTANTTYDTGQQANPSYWTVPTICIGSNDRSMQRLLAGTQPSGTSYKIRYEGYYTYQGGTLGSPTQVWELEFFSDGTFTLFTDAPDPNHVADFYSNGAVWTLFNGTPAAVHPYNGVQDANFTIPIVQGKTFKFTPGDANGSTFSCVQL